MSETLFNQFADEGALQAQKDFILKEILGPVKEGIKGLNVKIGTIDSTQSKSKVDELSRGVDILEKNLKRSREQMAEINNTLRLFVSQMGNATKLQRESAQAALLEAKAREVNAKATERQAAASAKAAAKKAEELRPYKILALAFSAAAKEAQDLAAKYGTLDKRSQAAAKRANELNNELKKIDATIGNHQRNVGNYGSAFDKVGASVRNLATNFLALIGVASVGSLFSSSIDEFVEMEKHVRQLQNTLKNLGVPEAFDRISTSADKLQKQFKFLDNDDILKSFNQLIVYGKLTEDQINDLIPVIIDFATATGQDLGSATSLIIKSLGGNGKALKEYGINLKDTKNTADAFKVIMTELKPRVDGVAKSFAESAGGGLAAAKQEFKDLKEEIGTGLIPILNDLLRLILRVPQGIKTFITGAKESLAGGTGFFQINVDAINQDKNFAATVQQQLEQRIDSYGAIQKNIEAQLGRKLASSKEDQKLLKDTQDTVLKGFKSSADSAQKEINAISKTLKNTQDDTFKLRSLMTTVQASLGAIDKLSTSTNKVLGIGDGNDPFKSGGGKKDDGDKKALELAKRNAQAEFELFKLKQQRIIDSQKEIADDEKEAFSTRLLALVAFTEESKKLIDAEAKFEKEKENQTAKEIELIEAKKYDKSIELQKTAFKKLSEIREGQQRSEIALKLSTRTAPDTSEAVNRVNDQIKEAHDLEMSLIEEKKKAYENLYHEVANAIQAVIGGVFDAEKNRLQDQIEKVDELKAKEIDRIDASTASEEKKAAQIKIIESKAQADKEALERRKKQVDRQRAIFERAFQSFQIIAEGIKTVAAIKLELAKLTARAIGNPFLASLIPFMASQIPIAIATSAAQLVALNAVPIPKYYTGTDYSKEGIAEVAERGPELAIDQKGNAKVYEKRTLAYLSRGTKIYPADATKDILNAADQEKSNLLRAFSSNVTISAPDQSEKLDKINETMKRIEKNPTRFTIYNEPSIETTAWYQKHIKH